MIKRMLVSGCSFTEHYTWPSRLFAPATYEVINKAKGGAGNEYIACSVMHHADTQPDFVFVLWSGINRTDLRVPNNDFFSTCTTTYTTADLGQSKFFLSGHAVDPDKGWLAGYNDIKDPGWPEITCVADWLALPTHIKKHCLDHKIYLSTHGGNQNIGAWCHQYFLTQYLDNFKDYRSERTWQNMLMCFNHLDQLQIPYRFSFIYDIWSAGEDNAHGQAVKNKFYHNIDWSKFIDLPPYQYGIKHNLLSDDQYHLTRDGMNQWAGEISQNLRDQKNLKHLFDL